MIPKGIMAAPIFEPRSGLPYENRVHIRMMTVCGHYTVGRKSLFVNRVDRPLILLRQYLRENPNLPLFPEDGRHRKMPGRKSSSSCSKFHKSRWYT
jgi:hypothetical protein